MYILDPLRLKRSEKQQETDDQVCGEQRNFLLPIPIPLQIYNLHLLLTQEYMHNVRCTKYFYLYTKYQGKFLGVMELGN